MAELPHLVKVAHESKEDGGEVVLVSQDLYVPGGTIDSAQAKVEAMIARRRIDVPMLLLVDDDLDPVSELLDLPGPIPVTLAFDAQGREVDRLEGDGDEARFRAMMRKALGQ